MNGSKEQRNGRNATLGLGDAAGVGGPPGVPLPNEIDITKDRLGEIMTARRHQLGLKIEEIAEDIKIRPDYLRAIEQEDFDSMPTPQYTRLFLKSYAERLGLAVSEIYAIYDLHHHPPTETAPPKPRGTVEGPTPILPSRGTATANSDRNRLGLYLVVGILALAIIIAGLFALFGKKDESQTTTEPPPPASATNTQTPVAPAPVPTEPASEELASGTVIEAEMRLVLSFSGDTWVHLIADADSVTNTTWRAGSTLEAKASNAFVLSLGHIDGVTATVNGHLLRPFSNRVLEMPGLVITADSVEEWLVPSDAEGLVPSGTEGLVPTSAERAAAGSTSDLSTDTAVGGVGAQ